MNDDIDNELECVFDEYTKDCYRLTREEADHLMKFRIKVECDRVSIKIKEALNRISNKVKEDVFRQVNKTKDGWKVKLIYYNCNHINNLSINSEMINEGGWKLSYDKKNWKGHAEKFFSKLY